MAFTTWLKSVGRKRPADTEQSTPAQDAQGVDTPDPAVLQHPDTEYQAGHPDGYDEYASHMPADPAYAADHGYTAETPDGTGHIPLQDMPYHAPLHTSAQTLDHDAAQPYGQALVEPTTGETQDPLGDIAAYVEGEHPILPDPVSEPLATPDVLIDPAIYSGTPDPLDTVNGKDWLIADGLFKSYKKRPVVRGGSLAVRRGESVGLLGPNGAGKTTMFYMITGLVPLDSGRITLDGHDISLLPMYRRARLGIGYLPQEASIFRGLSVEGNIRAVLEIVEKDKKKREYELDALLDEFNISHLRKSPSIALSGGERRRCEIARALASRPAFMLLDEPFAGIDPIAVGDIQTLVRHLTTRGIGVLITDHNVRETLGLIDRAYIIHSGKVLMQGTPEDIVASPDVRRLYLGEEFTM